MSDLVALPMSDKLLVEDRHSTKWRRKARGSTVPTGAVPTLRRLFELEDLCQTTEALRTVRCDFGLKDASRLCQETHIRTNSFMCSTSNSESLSRDSYADEQVYVLFQQKAIV